MIRVYILKTRSPELPTWKMQFLIHTEIAVGEGNKKDTKCRNHSESDSADFILMLVIKTNVLV